MNNLFLLQTDRLMIGEIDDATMASYIPACGWQDYHKAYLYGDNPHAIYIKIK